MSVLKDIFIDHYEEMIYTLHPRPSVIENVDKMINCGDPSFGRDLKWNPHIHCLISEGGYSNDGFWRNIKHFNYTFLRNAFRTALLNEMEQHLDSSFKQIKSSCYKDHPHRFYVYAKPQKCNSRSAIKYIGRYL